jgi:hypothetical protein
MAIGIALSVYVMNAIGAQGTDVLYTPVREIKDQNISVKGWGSGVISETDETAYEGTRTLRIQTKNFFQGGLLKYGSPIDLNRSFANKNSLLRIIFRPVDGAAGGGAPGRGGLPGLSGSSSPGRQNGPPGGLGGPGGPPGGFGGPGGPPGGFGGLGGPAGLGGAGGQGGPNAVPPFKMLRVILTTTDGMKSEAYVPTTTSVSAGERGWRSVAVPLQGISGFDKTNKTIKEVAFSADATTTFYVGDLRIVVDTTPIRADITPRSFNRELGAELIFSARGDGGSSVLKYTWDFDDTDGSDEHVDAEGQFVKRRFRKAGTYTITLTVQDYFGLKEKIKTSIKGTINP